MRPDPSIPQLLFRSVTRADVRPFPSRLLEGRHPQLPVSLIGPLPATGHGGWPKWDLHRGVRVSKVSKRSRAAQPGTSQRDSGRLHRPLANLRRSICGDGQRSRFVCRQGLLTERMDGSNQLMDTLMEARHPGARLCWRCPASFQRFVPGQAPSSSTLCPCKMKSAGAQTSARP